jgi:hypothetical protein
MSRTIILLGTAILLLAGCEKKAASVHPAFYFWKTTFSPADPPLQQYLEATNAQRLYVKFFDVDWDYKTNAPVPLASILWDSRPPDGIEIVPTVFITNRVFQQLPIQEIPALTSQLDQKIFDLLDQADHPRISEVQLDCDWTQSTREHYFRLLKSLKSRLSEKGIQLSATIRLHQVKYPQQTGVPPADRGMLMFYNMGDVQDWEEENSILNLEKAQAYLRGIDRYPLPLDLALPLFQWGVVFRDGEMIRLINQLDEKQLQDRTRFYPMGVGRFEVTAHTFLDGTFLYEGDFIRLEKVDTTLLSATVDVLEHYQWAHRLNLAFYHLDSTVVSSFDPAYLHQLLSRFE